MRSAGSVRQGREAREEAMRVEAWKNRTEPRGKDRLGKEAQQRVDGEEETRAMGDGR